MLWEEGSAVGLREGDFRSLSMPPNTRATKNSGDRDADKLRWLIRTISSDWTKRYRFFHRPRFTVANTRIPRSPTLHNPAHPNHHPTLLSSWTQHHGNMAIANTISSFLIQVSQSCKSHRWICLLYRAELATNAGMLGITLVNNTTPR